MFMEKVNEFYQLAKEYCEYIDRTTISFDNLEQTISLLLRLYLKCLELSDTADIDDGPDIDPPYVIKEIKFEDSIPGFYQQAPEPFGENEEQGWGMLEDDFRDIYNDMLKGIAEFEAGYPKDAAFTWRLLQWSHWGFHVVDAVRALHYLKWS